MRVDVERFVRSLKQQARGSCRNPERFGARLIADRGKGPGTANHGLRPTQNHPSELASLPVQFQAPKPVSPLDQSSLIVRVTHETAVAGCLCAHFNGT